MLSQIPHSQKVNNMSVSLAKLLQGLTHTVVKLVRLISIKQYVSKGKVQINYSHMQLRQWRSPDWLCQYDSGKKFIKVT
jgi:RNA-binding protein YlmH